MPNEPRPKRAPLGAPAVRRPVDWDTILEIAANCPPLPDGAEEDLPETA